MELIESAKWFYRDMKEINNIFRIKKELLGNQAFGPKTTGAMQQVKLRKVLRHAVTHSPFYRDLYKNIDIESCSLTDLPVIQKRDMMDNFDDFVTDPRLKLSEIENFLSVRSNAARPFKDEFVILNSSGTSGEIGVMAYHWKEFDYAFASSMARGNNWPATWLALPKYILGERLRVANIMMTNGHAASYITCFRISMDPESPIMANRFFSVFKPMDELCKELEEFQPHVLQAYSTALIYLAHEQLAGRLKLKFDDPRSAIVALSEPVSRANREICMEAFGKEITNTYGACESIVIARDCDKHTGMHLNSDFIILEPVDDDYNPVPPGTTADKVLITNLYTFAQPIIRYELNDRVCMETDKCTCGNHLPLVRSVEGRTDETLWIKGKNGELEPVHPYIFFVPTLNNPGIREYQAEQIERNKFIFRIVPMTKNSMTDSDVTRMVEKSLEEEGLKDRMQIIGKAVDSIPRDPESGKIIQVISRIGPPEDAAF